MAKQIDVAIIGTGTAALAAASEVKKVTDNFILVSNGVYGTTCVRAGCMPSKVFIHAAQLYHLRHGFRENGITGFKELHIHRRKLLEHVRAMREHFLATALKNTQRYKDHIIEGTVAFHSPNELRVNETDYYTKRVVLATGSSPIIPAACENCGGTILTSDTLFEQSDLPSTMDVLGMSVLGAEMAQALARLDIKVRASHDAEFIGGLSDPIINEYALRALNEEMDLTLNQAPAVFIQGESQADTLFVAMSRKANLEGMGLEECGIIVEGDPVMHYDPYTMQVKDLPVFVAGDVKLGRSILHEASDEGRIAGYNAARENITAFRRRTPLQITYTDPTIAVIGKAREELDEENIVTGEARFDDQGRAKIIGNPLGIIRIYADKETGKLVGAELFVPGGEHLAHMLAWLIDQTITVADALQLPFYHPTLEEGIRTALKELVEQLPVKRHLIL